MADNENPEVEEDSAAPAEEPAAEAAPAPAAAADAPKAEVEEAPAPRRRGPRPKPLKKEPKAKKERGTYVRQPKEPKEPGRRKERRGVVVSDKGDKTIAVRIDSAKPHPKYKKIVRRSSKLYAHDERNEAKVGDVVRVVECRPLSAMKRWRLIEIVTAGEGH
jgi:ribosomal protein uS17